MLSFEAVSQLRKLGLRRLEDGLPECGRRTAGSYGSHEGSLHITRELVLLAQFKRQRANLMPMRGASCARAEPQATAHRERGRRILIARETLSSSIFQFAPAATGGSRGFGDTICISAPLGGSAGIGTASFCKAASPSKSANALRRNRRQRPSSLVVALCTP